ncbi:hypothetical protein CHGG_06010 [Chaetomium globosum CBS 148.51]|uniref:Glutamine amidotransferase type-2 domain-containing protein n=1 Tax=Chaetomium globosum (strain ATCC 6205 / CBS 148.51 / DSM 1962 / NBRC 6347 / NRRL 1970) TaxID=306901 RepID=Q2H5Q5_CHAGB|nr:uncharacterized protein CHGG_06010 [Chaetomium globosum CBS 148.51]EAQ89391.1 hypothetical protein CHGG_06010 [Chaetomium globosum CBS 148.51]
MCGIAVSIALDRRQRQPCTPETRAELETKLSDSLDLIAHRGPDAKGIWINEDASVGLGHNRLSINDLSPAGNQPHHSPSNNIHAVINGEIYDPCNTLRSTLSTQHGYAFHSHTDTELVLALYLAHGSPAFLTHLRGEFSLVLYDARGPGPGKVVLARDRVGERTLFEGVRKVVPGGWVEVEVGGGGKMVKGVYWDLGYPDKVGNQDATSRIACFSIEFPDSQAHNESDIAERTANWLGVQILKQRMDEAALAENFADAAYHSEHHNMDLNSVGKFCLSKLPREHGFKVVLTGEGSDEHFAGYSFFIPDMLREPDLAMPESVLASDPELRADLHHRTEQTIEAGVRLAQTGTAQRAGDPEASHALNGVKILSWTQAWQSPLNVVAPQFRERWADPNGQLAKAKEIPTSAKEKIRTAWHPLHSAQYLWTKTLLANNLLTCLGDRTEMAHSIEARPPFLDHELSEYVNGLPPSVKLAYTPAAAAAAQKSGTPWDARGIITSSFTEKWILREAGKPYITQELYERRKQPYLAPSKWPRDGPMHRKMREICTQKAVEKLGFVDWEVVKKALDTGFGDDADNMAFRVLVVVGGWVSIGERFGVQRAELDG